MNYDFMKIDAQHKARYFTVYKRVNFMRFNWI